ncbi:helix-turn-helix domain-containing protein [Streptomyces zhihengii]|uniref:Helix-turn-helix domain-containing protein n=1 Tax=Streptomyces zhihengii TaxID=1818004 RepID=A0ABS2UU32_9ACTN|nr:helix-turn-helix transcriptional regulator [Streptomyces zhihengii]MBM9620989.1 helix-turn-helix domain-containing protein [Streptomyces zhihengii]
MDRDWARLGQRLKAAREARGLEQQAVAAAIGVGRGALLRIERGQVSRISPTIRAYATEVGWTADSPEAVLVGGEPTMAEPEESGNSQSPSLGVASVAPELVSELPWRIRAALADGPLIDTAVIDLPAGDDEDSDAKMVVIVRGRGELTPDQMRRALLRWEQTEAELRNTDHRE